MGAGSKVGLAVAGATVEAVAPLIPVAIVGVGLWYLYRQFSTAVANWSGDPKDPLFHPSWAAGPPPDWARQSGAADAYEAAQQAGGAGNPVTQNPVAGPYVPPTDWWKGQ